MTEACVSFSGKVQASRVKCRQTTRGIRDVRLFRAIREVVTRSRWKSEFKQIRSAELAGNTNSRTL